MLKNSIVYTSFSTNKLFESYAFYQNVLGLDVECVDDRFLHVYTKNENPVIIYHKEDHQAATFTVLNFQIENIAQVVNKLSTHGVSFLQYEAPIKTDPLGISWDDQGSHLAWFKDPGGNILALIEN